MLKIDETKRLAIIVKDMEAKVQTHIDSKAKELGYDDINSIGKYIGYDNPFRLECEALGRYNANCWIKAHSIQDEVIAGTRPMPTLEEVIAEIPEYTGVQV